MTNDTSAMMNDTPYLIADGPDSQAQFNKIRSRSADIRQRSVEVAEQVRLEAADLVGAFEERRRSNLVAESNRIEGYDWTAPQVQEVVEANRALLAPEVRYFVDSVRSDSRTLEALGLYRAYQLADDWAVSQQRPREYEMRQLHALIVPDEPFAGRYKTTANEISGSSHETVSHVDTPRAMSDLATWFEEGTGDPVLDAAIVHAWLTHIHPFDDGNGRLARLLANLALVQYGYPSLDIQSDAKAPYFDALEASDQGDILPLYGLFVKSLSRSVKRMERGGYVRGLITDHLFKNPPMLEAAWAKTAGRFLKLLAWTCRDRGWELIELGLPSAEQFQLLLDGDKDGNCWFAFLAPEAGESEILLWFGHRSSDLRETLSGEHLLPSIFFSRRDRRPHPLHRFQPIRDGDGPLEVVLYPDRREQRPTLVRLTDHRTVMMTFGEATHAIADAYCTVE